MVYFWNELSKTQELHNIQALHKEIGNAVVEIVAWLDGGTPFSAPGEHAVQTLEAIIAFHVSHDRGAGWVELPLTGEDRNREVRSG